MDPSSNGTVLFLGSHGGPDYSRDMALHGLRSLLGNRLVDRVRPRHLYRLKDYDLPQPAPPGVVPLAEAEARARAGLYGEGFTFAHHLPIVHDDYMYEAESGAGNDGRDWAGGGSKHSVDRTEERVRGDLRAGRFDLVVYGSVHRGRPFWVRVLAASIRVPTSAC